MVCLIFHQVAPDFFEYFRALHPILKSDPALWCVSAWNDNGREGFVDPGKASLLYRTDFFPGLGWMLTKDLWAELEPKWPASFWDDWMRHPRSAQRPVLHQTRNFQNFNVRSEGCELGQFYDKYLRFIKLNSEFVPFTKMDLSYLEKKKYDESFEKEVYGAPVVTVEDLQSGKLSGSGPFRVQYSSPDSFKTLARNLVWWMTWSQESHEQGIEVQLVSFTWKEGLFSSTCWLESVWSELELRWAVPTSQEFILRCKAYENDIAYLLPSFPSQKVIVLKFHCAALWWKNL